MSVRTKKVVKSHGLRTIISHLFEHVHVNITGLIKVDLEFSFSIPGLLQTWNSNKPGFENLNSRSAPGF